MNKKTNEPNRPTHAIWHVRGEGDNARWTRIGAAWMHKDLKGANLKFDLMPISGRTVLREISAEEPGTTDTQGGAE